MTPLVLVVDDDDAIRAVVSELLHHAGIDARCASDGGEALEILHGGEVPDLVLLDLAMPNVDGWRVLAALADDAKLRTLPVVVLTSFSAPDDLPTRVRCIHKPVDPEVLLQVVKARLVRDEGARA